MHFTSNQTSLHLLGFPHSKPQFCSMEGKSKESDSYSTSPLNEVDIKSFIWDCNGDDESHEHCSAPKVGSVEIMSVEEEQAIDGEAELGSAAICRICLEHDGDAGDVLIAPCECKGTNQFVHRSCLDKWRSVKEGFAFAHCTTCKAQFHLRINFLEDSCWRNVKFRMLVARDVILVFLAVQMMISMLGGLTYLCDRHGSFREYIGQGWGHIFSMHPVLFYYCFGSLLILPLLGILGCCCGAHHVAVVPGHQKGNLFTPSVLQFALVAILVVIFAIIGIFYVIFAATLGFQRIIQRHYTKEYVVEDLHGNYTPPKLDQEHEERLRMLKLL